MPEKTLAMYIRLSVEDGDLRSSTDKSESNSVTNQRKILQSYIEQTHDLLLIALRNSVMTAIAEPALRDRISSA